MTDDDRDDPSPWAACAFAACVATRWYPTAAAAGAWAAPGAALAAVAAVWDWLEGTTGPPALDVGALQRLVPVEEETGLLVGAPGSIATEAVVRPLVDVAAVLAGSVSPADAARDASMAGSDAADTLAYAEVGPPPGAAAAPADHEALLAAPVVAAERAAQDEDLAAVRAGGGSAAAAAALRAVNEERGRRLHERARQLGWP